MMRITCFLGAAMATVGATPVLPSWSRDDLVNRFLYAIRPCG